MHWIGQRTREYFFHVLYCIRSAVIMWLICEVLHWLVRRTYIHVFSYIRSPESRGLISEFLTLDGPEDICTLIFFINKNTVIIWLNSEVLNLMIQRTYFRISHIYVALWLKGWFLRFYIGWSRLTRTYIFFQKLYTEHCGYRVYFRFLTLDGPENLH